MGISAGHYVIIDFVLLLFVNFVPVVVSNSCPEPMLLKPCICNEQKSDSVAYQIECSHSISWKRTRQALSTFRNSSSLLDIHILDVTIDLSSNVFRGLSISELVITNCALMQHRMVRGNRTAVVPKGFFTSKTLVWLVLENNDLDHVPAGALARLQHLESLSLKMNKIEKIQRHSFRKLENLKLLDLSTNKIKEIHTRAFERLKQLEVIKLADNYLDKVPNLVFQNQKRLRILDLSNNGLHYLSADVLTPLCHLEHLSLSYNPHLRNASHAMLHINSSLTTLEIGNTDIHIPDFTQNHCLKTLVSSNRSPLDLEYIAKIDELEKLDMQNCVYDDMQLNATTFIDLNHTFYKIRYLDLSYNMRLKEVESFLHFFPSLTHLYLEKVRLRRLKANFSQPIQNLSSLVVTNCGLQKIHRLAFAGLEDSLVELDLSRNWLQYLQTETMHKLRRLQHVDLSYNRFQDITVDNNKTYPLDKPLFRAASATLTHLSLATNFLQIIPIKLVKPLKNLRYLNMAGNELSFVNSNLMASNLFKLESLNLNNNRIKSIYSKAFYKLYRLKELSLSYNLLEKLTDIEFPESLQYLRLKNNLLKTLDGTFEIQGNLRYLPSLKVVDLNDNKLENISRSAFKASQKSLVYLDISGNMLNCSCSMKPFIEWLGNYRVVISESTMCSSPDKLTGHKLIDGICWSTCNTTNLDNLYCTLGR